MHNRPFIAAAALLLCLAAVARGAPATRPAAAAAAKVDLDVAAKGWAGDDGKDDVRAVLKSAAAQILRHVPDAEAPRVRVGPGSGPITWFKRDPDGAIVVKLNAGSRCWAQYAYQFAHETTHILCGYREGEQANLWFEETMCEAGSLFALRRMAEVWATDPPYRNWRSYSKSLSEYADERMKAHRLPAGTKLSKWYLENAEALRANPTGRERNSAVAIALLPLIEAEPEHAWTALRHLNDGRAKDPIPFDEYLRRWHEHTPEAHRGFVKKVAAELGVEIGK
ncbi:MAG TPA: hypothetical protein VF796_29275 [Humisphaera sp.]